MIEKNDSTKSSTELMDQIKQEIRSEVAMSNQDDSEQMKTNNALRIKNGTNTVLFFGVLSFLYSLIVTIIAISWLQECGACHNDSCGNCAVLLFVPLGYLPSVIAFIIFGILSHFVKKRFRERNYGGSDYLDTLNRRRVCGFCLLLIPIVVLIILTMTIYLPMMIH